MDVSDTAIFMSTGEPPNDKLAEHLKIGAQFK
jgi:hypothetical protein